jgi:hypothetical protein
MHAHNSCRRFSTRLGLEALEGRTLLSATLPTATLGVAHQAAATTVQVHHLSAQPVRVNFSYNWQVGPSAVLTGRNSSTGNGRSTGSVDFALVRSGGESAPQGGLPVGVPLGFVVTTSSASDGKPDTFNTAFTLTLRIRDAASGTHGVLTFKGKITGKLTATRSSLTVTFDAPSQRLVLGRHVYTVTLPRTVHPTGPYDAPSALFAFVQVSARENRPL